MPVLCLNSHVVYGYVGNDAGSFCLRRLGVETWQVDTVALSNHPGYGDLTGRVVPAAELRALVDGVAARGVLEQTDALLSGYLGAAEQAAVVAHAGRTLRAANPQALVIADPVMGDAEPGLYVGQDIAEALAREVVPNADVVTPNAFELGWLTGRAVAGWEDALSAARALIQTGPGLVIVTSIPTSDDSLGLLAVTAERAWALGVPRLDFPVAPNGAGDALAGLITAHLVRGSSYAQALGAAGNAIHRVLEATRDAGRRELALPLAQDMLVAPGTRFAVRELEPRAEV
ncbi:pyridoxal kinase PdxY [Rhodovibrio salinarum]|uniref:pyridoxal kinase n=1 Tax=Rhodovibrio salinarum TaxID=1087 RepID=A0A934QI11_9PROT|nr:pyridoxal kinase PdxY [Rhodovibrio salinarum]MBK1697143.1 pyridoxal kinase PdxY [Rhodovibrio salinarum]